MSPGNPLLIKGILIASFIFLLFASTVHASESLQVTLSRAQIYFNNVLKTPEENLPILDHNGRTYVPLRFLSESTGNYIGYDNASKEINVDTEYSGEFRPKISDSQTDGDFKLTIRSNQASYKYGEPLAIWGELTYNGEANKVVYHGNPLLSFGVTDSEEVGTSELVQLMRISSEMKKDDEFMRVYSDSLTVAYHMLKDNVQDPLAYLNNAPRPSRLPPGSYTIQAYAQFTDADTNEHKRLAASLDIAIEP